MSIGVLGAHAIATADAQGWHPVPAQVSATPPRRPPFRATRARFVSEWAKEQAARRWAEFLVDAAFRAGRVAAAQRPCGRAAGRVV
jgi:hypothetical protein